MNLASYLRHSYWHYLAFSLLALAIIFFGINNSFFSYILEHNRINNIFGIFFILAICVVLSKDRKAINIKLVSYAMLMHLALAIFVLKTTYGQIAFGAVAQAVNQLYLAAGEGISFVFGKLAIPTEGWGFIFAIKVLPIIIFFGAFMSLLFHLGVVQKVVAFLGMAIAPILGTSGAETLCAISNSFLGQTEAPLLIKNYLSTMTKSEFLVVMVSGMGTISGAILAVFAAMGVPVKHLLASSVMSIPATILISKILYPETERAITSKIDISDQPKSGNALDAISQGTSDGLQLALNVGAMLITFLSLIAIINSVLSFSSNSINQVLISLGFSFSLPNITLQNIFAVICMPFSWLLGFSGSESWKVSELLGTKVAINELVAYGKMLTMDLSQRTMSIVTYALCGFSNFSCIGIQIGGIGALVPEKRAWLSELGLYAVLGGALANLLSAMVASLLL